jgi:hypothetical protein
MRYHERLDTISLPAIALGIVLLLALVGCGSGIRPAVSVIGSTPTPKPRPPTPVVTAASTTGWTMYRDPRFPFEVPQPPGWRASVFYDTDHGGVNGPCAYTVYFFLPGSTATGQLMIETHVPEYISVGLKLNCPRFDPLANHWLVAEPLPISFGGQPSTLYDNDGEGWVQRVTVTDFGENQWGFSYGSNTSENYTHLALYLAMVQDFRYLG